ncbi:MAG: hypothetical protein GY756_02390 [bacterium]|nr:hypothetical protein [bacterium]
MYFIRKKTRIGSVSFLFSILVLLTGCGSSANTPYGESPSYQNNADTAMNDSAEILGSISNIENISSENTPSPSTNSPAIAPGAFSNNTQNPKPQPFATPSTPQKSYNNVNISGEIHKTYPANTSMNKIIDDTNKQMKNNIKEELKNQK